MANAELSKLTPVVGALFVLFLSATVSAENDYHPKCSSAGGHYTKLACLCTDGTYINPYAEKCKSPRSKISDRLFLNAKALCDGFVAVYNDNHLSSDVSELLRPAVLEESGNRKEKALAAMTLAHKKIELGEVQEKHQKFKSAHYLFDDSKQWACQFRTDTTCKIQSPNRKLNATLTVTCVSESVRFDENNRRIGNASAWMKNRGYWDGTMNFGKDEEAKANEVCQESKEPFAGQLCQFWDIDYGPALAPAETTGTSGP